MPIYPNIWCPSQISYDQVDLSHLFIRDWSHYHDLIMIQSPLQMTKDFITLEYLNIHVMKISSLLNNKPECTYESNKWLVGHPFLIVGSVKEPDDHGLRWFSKEKK